ncbi:hypothetical protein [Streptomyces odontomachi]|nr:hypothetical protein [Streptomyces sp. ODS25]
MHATARAYAECGRTTRAQARPTQAHHEYVRAHQDPAALDTHPHAQA